MKEVKTDILITAPIELLWKIFTDFDSYKDWNTVMSIEGQAQLGEHLKLSIQLGNKLSIFKTKVVEVSHEQTFEWTGNLGHKRIFSGQHYFHFKPEGEGQTRLTHGERFSGIFSHPIVKKIETDTRNSFEAFNLALKEHAENLVI
ncbi:MULTISPECIES: SRPBCC domain-containing protein [Reichenbachiella]|uniref:Polyketide cyclase / dehydrase and lipid transport n=1 Tax=Reichenbachiella agariperforans TaxID=156994 RepID=A0A1M6N922_REIAG|nr:MULTISPECIES: SRPBCC domain-containing protein [Reichenbachiella]MBU2915776.1 SRPBCC domain-containing protein [Reichenbachiella agariperforans]RJE71958.1 hypothetical protein BGP76_07710 [Reichenbachiella sp. MSK19-1]SHJ92066.1 hypothetical protein SAMN04488028_102151 [Reichenbachiella agariperforans]